MNSTEHPFIPGFEEDAGPVGAARRERHVGAISERAEWDEMETLHGFTLLPFERDVPSGPTADAGMPASIAGVETEAAGRHGIADPTRRSYAPAVRVRIATPGFVSTITKIANRRRPVFRTSDESDAFPRRDNCSTAVPAMSDKDTFGPRLRSERERRGISLETIASVTNVGVELWQGLERNDFSRWPTGIFARAFVRDYARAVGVDSDEVVDEFCRLFPIGDRRAARVIRAQAQLIGQAPEYQDETALIPGGVERRASAPSAIQKAAAQGYFVPRTFAAILDTAAVLTAGSVLSLAAPVGFGASMAIAALVYYTAGTLLTGRSPGSRATDLLRQRIPTLFVQDRRAHA
ncbi:MAG TPA: helix-turn-helix transcriptional regulator [Vicinamibacterales bacterium]|nr:helix-turn-helix transcriptional regulator [Vicinamibacterales bacterium]